MSDSTILNTITVDGVTYDAASYAAAAKASTSTDNSVLGKDAFLQLLVTQMRYQDPLDPQDNSDYLAQLAQFSALEQMTNVSEGLEGISQVVNNIDTSVLVGQLSSMIGQDVEWETKTSTTDEKGNVTVNTKTYVGKVKGVSIADGSPTIIAESEGARYEVPVSDVNRVGEGVGASYDGAQ